MARQTWYRISAVLLVMGGLFMALTVLDVPVPQPLSSCILLVGGGSLLLGIPTLYARHRRQVGVLGLIGLAILALNILVYPVQGGISGLVHGFQLPPILYISGPLTLLGSLLFGIAAFRRRAFPGWLCWTPFAGWVLSGIGNLVLTGPLAAAVGDPGEWLFWLSFTAFGALMLREQAIPETAPAPVTARHAS